MKIVIAHLYYDLLNLYGENGNIKALKKYFENQNIEVEIKKISLYDKLVFTDYDLVYIGMGTENNQLIALEHLIEYKKEIKEYINNNGFLLSTGNSFELFGKNIIDLNNNKKQALGIFPYSTKLVENRIIYESIVKYDILEQPIIGFQNRASINDNNKNHWFSVIKNFGAVNNTDLNEGIHIKNFYGTYIIGPLLVRNPHLLEHIANKIIMSKNKKFKIKENNFELEYKAYTDNLKRYEEK